MKRMGLLLLMLCLLSNMTLAEDTTIAVVDAGDSTRLHLREEPASDSASLGLYMTGTQVECLTDPEDDWVQVKIGREKGYMRGGYLKTNREAEIVTPLCWTGRTNAKNYARVRKGPSTEHQMAFQVKPEDEMRIWGETDENWYYVEVDGEYGFISKKLVDVTEIPTAQQPVYDALRGWKAAYRAYLYAENPAAIEACGLIDVDGDDTPELAIDTGVEVGGCQILTYANGELDVLQTHRRGFTYLPGENLLCNSDGLMGGYFDLVYTIQNGKWKQIAVGQWEEQMIGWDEKQGSYEAIESVYRWNGQNVTGAAYERALSKIYDAKRAAQPDLMHNRDTMIGVLSR